jgi:hypothetical protein
VEVFSSQRPCCFLIHTVFFSTEIFGASRRLLATFHHLSLALTPVFTLCVSMGTNRRWPNGVRLLKFTSVLKFHWRVTIRPEVPHEALALCIQGDLTQNPERG